MHQDLTEVERAAAARVAAARASAAWAAAASQAAGCSRSHVAASSLASSVQSSIAALIIEADRELRFLTDQELSAIQAELAAGDSAEGALLRAAAAVNYLL